MPFVKPFSVLLLASFAPFVMASENRQHSSHEHGVGQLDVAQEGAEFQIALTSPAVNIFGFEHAPHDQEDREMVKTGLAELEKGGMLFVFPKGAGCRLEDVHVATSLAGHETHEKHEHEDHEKHDHEKHEHTDHEDDESAHSDVMASWHFDCAHPEAVGRIDVKLFEHFPQTEHLRVQWVIGNKQGAAELSSKNAVLQF